MGYAMTAVTDTQERADKVVERLQKMSQRPEFKHDYLTISSDSEEHPYAPDVKPCVCISYSTLTSEVHRFCWNVMYNIATEYGTVFYYDDERQDLDEGIQWDYKIHPDSGFFMRQLEKYVVNEKNERIRKLKDVYDTYVEPVISTEIND